MEVRHTPRRELTLFMPILVTAPLFGLICGLLLGQLLQ
jgi:hypothetical protein